MRILLALFSLTAVVTTAHAQWSVAPAPPVVLGGQSGNVCVLDASDVRENDISHMVGVSGCRFNQYYPMGSDCICHVSYGDKVKVELKGNIGY